MKGEGGLRVKLKSMTDKGDLEHGVEARGELKECEMVGKEDREPKEGTV